jgi:hypothetical protein
VFRRSRNDRPLRATTRRLVQTSKGPVLLEIGRFVGGVHVSVNAYDGDGWEVGARRVSWIDEGAFTRAGDYREAGGRESMAEAIADATALSPAESETIADECLREWESRVSEEDLDAARFAKRASIALLALAVFFVVGFFALLIVVLVTVVF